MANKKNTILTKHQEDVLIPITMDDVREKIIVLRGEPVILDMDVAALYGVQTKEVNQAVKNNPGKFPVGYLFMLNNQEVAEMRSKILTTSVENAEDERIKHKLIKSHYNPVAFTERGLYMMATILKSKQAELTTIAIIDTFASVKELARTIRELQGAANKNEQKGLLKRSGELIGEIIGNDMSTSETETALELNFAVLKVKHTIKRKKNSDINKKK